MLICIIPLALFLKLHSFHTKQNLDCYLNFALRWIVFIYPARLKLR